uniref:Uncharacterized protein n=1 Tax=Anopheles funestus TaxID=62324 RepID=A0A182S317_ANOFN
MHRCIHIHTLGKGSQGEKKPRPIKRLDEQGGEDFYPILLLLKAALKTDKTSIVKTNASNGSGKQRTCENNLDHHLHLMRMHTFFHKTTCQKLSERRKHTNERTGYFGPAR